MTLWRWNCSRFHWRGKKQKFPTISNGEVLPFLFENGEVNKTTLWWKWLIHINEYLVNSKKPSSIWKPDFMILKLQSHLYRSVHWRGKKQNLPTISNGEVLNVHAQKVRSTKLFCCCVNWNCSRFCVVHSIKGERNRTSPQFLMGKSSIFIRKRWGQQNYAVMKVVYILTSA